MSTATLSLGIEHHPTRKFASLQVDDAYPEHAGGAPSRLYATYGALPTLKSVTLNGATPLAQSRWASGPSTNRPSLALWTREAV